MSSKKNKVLSLLFFIFFVLLDQVAKFFVTDFGFPYSENSLFILGFFPFNNYLYFLLVILASTFIIKNIIISRNFTVNFAYTVLLAGVISQASDRLRQGFVVDYINILNVTYVNFADLYIVCGVAMFFIYSSISKVERGIEQ